MPYTRRQLEALELTPQYVHRDSVALAASADVPPASVPAATFAADPHAPPPPGASPFPTPRSFPPLPAPHADMPRPRAAPTPAPTDATRQQAISILDWDALASATRDCKACDLCRQRKQAVLGVGHPNAPWLFVGEGPGADEDEHGEPFVGSAGKLLDGILTATGLARGREVYIANVVKCRPPSNRTPLPEETAACAPFLDRQIALIKPKIIVALGKTAAVRVTGQDVAMGSLRGKVWEYQSIPVVVTYHPAYLLRNLPEKAKAWEDMLFARKIMARIR